MLDQRIARRYQDQLAAGFLDEVRRLADAPEPLSATASQALGYRELLAHLRARPRWTRPWSWPSAAPVASSAARNGGSDEIPRISWIEGGHNALADTLARLGD